MFEEDVDGSFLSCIASVSFDGKVGGIRAGSVASDVLWRSKDTDVSEGFSFAVSGAVAGLCWLNRCEVSSEWCRFAVWRVTEELCRFKECEVSEDLIFSVTAPIQELLTFIESEVFEGFVFGLGLFGRDMMIRSADNKAMNIDE